MIILALTLTAWAILRKYAQKPARRAVAPVYAAPPVLSPAEINRREKERERAQREAERTYRPLYNGFETDADRESHRKWVAEQRRKEEEKERKAEAKRQKEEAARAQAEEDIPYLLNQLDRLKEMIEDAKADLRIARQRVQYDAEMNAHGAVIAEKIVNKHIAERDKAMRKVMSLETQIHSKEKQLTKAQLIAQN